uniref:Uncharacterized protein n=1 Tax=Rhizophora mucronata TaxID=61149 RepID=A0A2P2MZC0_RHIMU
MVIPESYGTTKIYLCPLQLISPIIATTSYIILQSKNAGRTSTPSNKTHHFATKRKIKAH